MGTEQQCKRITTIALNLLKQKGIKITTLTAYDFITAKILEEAGAFDLVLKKFPATLTNQVNKMLNIPTSGIGTGLHCDGQIIVSPLLLG